MACNAGWGSSRRRVTALGPDVVVNTPVLGEVPGFQPQDLRELVDALRSQLQSQGAELVARRRELHVILQQKALPEAVGRPWWRFW
jgi:hypothetical protein